MEAQATPLLRHLQEGPRDAAGSGVVSGGCGLEQLIMFLIFEECMTLQNTDTGVPAYTNTHTHTHTHTHTYTYTHTHTHTHTQTHTHIHTHIHTQWGQAHKLPYQQHRCLLDNVLSPLTYLTSHTHTIFLFIFKGIEECMQYVTVQLLCLHSKIK